jgi:DNA-binding NarL/FixJ family response regulator
MHLRTLVVDDHEAVCHGLTVLFTGSTVSITQAAPDGQTAMQHLSDGKFDAVLLDVQMKEVDGLTVLSMIRSKFPNLPVVFISAFDYPVYVARAVANGADDYVLKCDPPETIKRALHHACQTGGGLPGGLLDRVRKKLTAPVGPGDLPDGFPLTGREGQVLRHVAYGLSNREIGRSLKISVETVKEHVQNILRKTGASDRTDAAVRAVRAGVVD